MTALIPCDVGIGGSEKINTLDFKKIILCADDYAQNPSVSDGILHLLKTKKINAASCLVNSPLWETAAESLLRFNSSTFIGLHLNFTWGKALSPSWRTQYGKNFFSLGKLIKKCYLGSLNKKIVAEEVKAQLDNFYNKMGNKPDFIDGHQHVHQLPIIRDVLLAMHKKQKIDVWYRSTSDNLSQLLSLNSFPKQQLIALLGGLNFRKNLLRQGISTNTSFAGIYNFNRVAKYRKYFQQFLDSSSDRGLIMCHPGFSSKDKEDPLRNSRAYELAYFSSEDFQEDLKTSGVQLADKMQGMRLY